MEVEKGRNREILYETEMIIQTAGPIQYQRRRRREEKPEIVKTVRKDGKNTNKNHARKYAPGSNM